MKFNPFLKPFVLALGFGTLVTLSGCQEEEETLTLTDVVEINQTVQSDNNSQQESDIVNEFVNLGLEDEGSSKTGVDRYRRLPAAADVTWTNDDNDDGQTGDYRLTVDFGTVGLACYDGRTRRGIISATANGLYRNTGTVITTQTEGYAVSRNAGLTWTEHDFVRTVTNNGENTAGNIQFTVVETDAVTEPGGQEVNWSSTRTREWDWGTDNLRFTTDDAYIINGTGVTERVGVRTIDHTATNVTFKFNCGVVFSGVITHVDRDSGNSITVDYGTGCTVEKTVTYLINGQSYTFTL
jgi:hypothetical protein